MITVNSLSGGRTSSYMAVHYPADHELFALVCIDDPSCVPKDKAIIDYVNIKLDKYSGSYGEFIATAEDDATILALMDLEQLLGREITWIRGESFDKILVTAGINGGKPTRLPNRRFRYCTFRMKLLPIFEWWFYNIGEKIKMRIGFRFDEYDRVERFFNNSDPNNFEIPVAQSTRGQKLLRNQMFNWRECSMPLVKHGVTRLKVNEYWQNNGWIGETSLFEQRRQIRFPLISNCTMCHVHKPEELSIMAVEHPNKMNWASGKENLGMGTWLDSKITYQQIIENANHWIPEMIREGVSCDSGSCTD